MFSQTAELRKIQFVFKKSFSVETVLISLVVLNDDVQNECFRFLIFSDFKYVAASASDKSCVCAIINLSVFCVITNVLIVAFSSCHTGCTYQQWDFRDQRLSGIRTQFTHCFFSNKKKKNWKVESLTSTIFTKRGWKPKRIKAHLYSCLISTIRTYWC